MVCWEERERTIEIWDVISILINAECLDSHHVSAYHSPQGERSRKRIAVGSDGLAIHTSLCGMCCTEKVGSDGLSPLN